MSAGDFGFLERLHWQGPIGFFVQVRSQLGEEPTSLHPNRVGALSLDPRCPGARGVS